MSTTNYTGTTGDDVLMVEVDDSGNIRIDDGDGIFENYENLNSINLDDGDDTVTMSLDSLNNLGDKLLMNFGGEGPEGDTLVITIDDSDIAELLGNLLTELEAAKKADVLDFTKADALLADLANEGYDNLEFLKATNVENFLVEGPTGPDLSGTYFAIAYADLTPNDPLYPELDTDTYQHGEDRFYYGIRDANGDEILNASDEVVFSQYEPTGFDGATDFVDGLSKNVEMISDATFIDSESLIFETDMFTIQWEWLNQSGNERILSSTFGSTIIHDGILTRNLDDSDAPTIFEFYLTQGQYVTSNEIDEVGSWFDIDIYWDYGSNTIDTVYVDFM